MKKLTKLIGKKIVEARIEGIKNCDDKPFLVLKMSDGTEFRICAYYGFYTGKSHDEYPRFIKIKETK